jgi:hypothetical protein
MVMQWRSKDKGDAKWSDWEDANEGETIQLSVSLSWLSGVEVREKPEFEPGYFYNSNTSLDHPDLRWFSTEPPSSTYEWVRFLGKEVEIDG